MTYLFLKSLHVAAVLLFAGGLMVLALVAFGDALNGGVLLPHELRILRSILKWDRFVTLPALVALWCCGMSLEFLGGWTGQGWLTAKMGLVIVLTALHGILAASLRRRLEHGAASRYPWLRNSPFAVVVCLCLIAALVIFKP